MLGFAVSSVRAEDVNWSYSWSGTTPVSIANGGGINFNLMAGTFTNSKISVPAVTLEAFGVAGNITDGKYSLTMHLVDNTSHQFADLVFAGVLSGPTNLGLVKPLPRRWSNRPRWVAINLARSSVCIPPRRNGSRHQGDDRGGCDCDTG